MYVGIIVVSAAIQAMIFCILIEFAPNFISARLDKPTSLMITRTIANNPIREEIAPKNAAPGPGVSA